MKPLLLSEIIDLVREGALAADGEVIKVRDVKPLALPLHTIMEVDVLAYSVSAVKVTENGHGFARHYVVVQTGDAAGGMVEVGTGLSDVVLVGYVARMLTGQGMKEVATLDLKV